MRVAATVDVVLARAQSAKDMLGADLATTDYRQVLSHVDAVLIATPHPALQGCAPAGPVDPEAHVIKIVHPETKAPLAFIVNYPLHNNAASAIKTAISADFSGMMAEALRRVYGPHASRCSCRAPWAISIATYS